MIEASNNMKIDYSMLIKKAFCYFEPVKKLVKITIDKDSLKNYLNSHHLKASSYERITDVFIAFEHDNWKM